MNPVTAPFRSLTFVPSRYADNRCTWVAAWYPQPGDPGVEQRGDYLYPNSRYRITVISPEAPPAAPDGYQSDTVHFSGGYPAKCTQQKRKVEVASGMRGRCGYEGRLTVRRVAEGLEIVGLQGGAEVLLIDALGRVYLRQHMEQGAVIPRRGRGHPGFLMVKTEGGKTQVFPVWW